MVPDVDTEFKVQIKVRLVTEKHCQKLEVFHNKEDGSTYKSVTAKLKKKTANNR